MTGRAALAASAAVVVGLGAMAYFALDRGGDDPFGACREGVAAGGAASIGGPFELVGIDGKPVTDADVITGPTLVYFGYAYCPDFCPTDLSRNSLAAGLARDDGVDLGQVFISIDPERDRPEVMGDFTSSIDPRLVGLTGSPEQVAAAAAAYKVFYRKAGEGVTDYLMDHTTFTYLVAPGHPFLDFYSSDESPEAIAESVRCFAGNLEQPGS